MGIVPWGAEDLHLVTVGCGTSSRGTLGAAGGYPGANAPVRIIRGADIASTRFGHGLSAADPSALTGEIDRIAQKGVTHLAATDVLDMSVSTGGGGYGDPLDRDPERVRVDVLEGVVSEEISEQVYGVPFDCDGNVDPGGVRVQRERIRAERFGRAGATPLLAPAELAALATDGLVSRACPHCASSARIEFNTPVDDGAPRELSAASGLFELRHRCCAGCGRLTEIDLVRSSSP
jgi:N-methylhydantoinase B